MSTPVALDAEAAVLSAVIIDPAKLDQLAELQPKHFHADANRRIYEAMLAVRERGEPIDNVTIKEELKARGRLDQVGGAPYIAQITDATPAVANVQHHAQLVRDASRKRDAVNFGRLMAAEASNGLADFDSWFRSKRHALEQLEGGRATGLTTLDAAGIFAPQEPVTWLVRGLDLAPGAPALIAGLGFSGKTVAAQSMAVSVAAGLPLWGAFTVRQGPVLHLDYEQGARLTRERTQRLAAALAIGPSDLPGLRLCTHPGVYLDDPKAEDLLARELDGAALAIIDSFRAAVPSMDENESDARRPLDMLARVSERTGCLPLVIHHARKPTRDSAGGTRATIRGSGAIYEACGSVLVLDGDGAGDPTRCFHVKARISGRLADDFVLRIEDVEVDGNPRGGLGVTAERLTEARREHESNRALDGLKERIRAFMREGGDQPNKNVIRARLAVNRDRFFAAMAELEASGEVVNVGTDKKPCLRLVEVPK